MKKDTYLVFLLYLKWIAELVYFVGLVFVIGTALLFILNKILGIDLSAVHLIAVIALTIYSLTAYFISNGVENVVMTTKYFATIAALGYVTIASAINLSFVEILLKEPMLSFYVGVPFLLAFVYKLFYRPLMTKAVLSKTKEEGLAIDFSSLESIKTSMLEAVKDSIEPNHRQNIDVIGHNYRQDLNGKMVGIFHFFLKRKFFKKHRAKILEVKLDIDTKL